MLVQTCVPISFFRILAESAFYWFTAPTEYKRVCWLRLLRAWSRSRSFDMESSYGKASKSLRKLSIFGVVCNAKSVDVGRFSDSGMKTFQRRGNLGLWGEKLLRHLSHVFGRMGDHHLKARGLLESFFWEI